MTTTEYNESVQLYADRLYRFAIKCSGKNQDADDIVQNVFEKLWKIRETVEVDTCKALLFRMVKNNVIDIYRYNKVRQDNQALFKESTNSLSNNYEITDLIENAFKQLSDQSKSLILLRDYEGYNYEDIAEIMEISLSQVKVYLYRARKQMQASIKQLELEI